MSFKDDVYSAVKKIPKGEVRSYKEVAMMIGRPRSYRAVGNVLNKNRDPEVPCHRVVRSDGVVGGFAWGSERKRAMLQAEGAI